MIWTDDPTQVHRCQMIQSSMDLRILQQRKIRIQTHVNMQWEFVVSMASCSFNEGLAALVGNIPYCDLPPTVLNARMQSVYDGNVVRE